jgi:hypothetical protein
MKKNLVGRCGVYCGSCEIHRAYKDKGKLLLDIARKHNCLPGDVRCEGCGAVHVIGWARAEGWGKDCEIRKCQQRRELQTCGECHDVRNCGRWNALAEEYQSMGMDLKANLQAMSNGGLGEWLDKMDQRWRCQQCGVPTVASNNNPRCLRCGTYQL